MTEETKKKSSSCVNFKPEVMEKADTVVRDRLIPGVTNRSGLIDYALRKVFRELDMEG